MWICDAMGFFSIVKKDYGGDELLAKAQVYEDLKRLADRLTFPATAIVETPRADYRYRMTAMSSAIAQYLAVSALVIDYDNFKASLPRKTPNETELLPKHRCLSWETDGSHTTC